MVTVSEFIMRLTVDTNLWLHYRNPATKADVIEASGMSESDRLLFTLDDQEGILQRVAEEGVLIGDSVDADTSRHGVKSTF